MNSEQSEKKFCQRKKDNMKNLYIIFDQIPPLDSGGLVITYINMVKYLKESYNIKIVSVFKSRELDEQIFSNAELISLSNFQLDNRFYRIFQYMKSGKIGKSIKALFSAFYFFAYIRIAKHKLAKRIRDNDFVISVSPTASAFIPSSIEFIQDIHTNYEYFWGNKLLGKMQSKLMSKPKLTVFRNKRDADKGAKHFPSTYLYNFVDEINYNFKDFELNTRRNHFLYMGRLHPQKNPLRLLKCAKILKDRGYTFTLDIYGTGMLKEELEQEIINMDLSKNVFLRGYTTDKNIYNKYSMLWLTSELEGLGLCILEAKANATPTISVNWGGAIKEVIEDQQDGFIANDDHEFVNYVINLLEDDKLLKKMSKNAYDNYHKNFSNEATKHRLIEIIETYKSK